MAKVSPPPLQTEMGSVQWLEWFRLIQIVLQQKLDTVTWVDIDFTGSDLADIATKSHNSLDSIQGGSSTERYHLSQSEHACVSAFDSVATPTSAYSIGVTDHLVLGDGTGGAFNVTLPNAANYTGREFIVKKIDSSANAITVATSSSQTIDGAATYVLSAQYDAVTVVSGGSNWHITGVV